MIEQTLLEEKEEAILRLVRDYVKTSIGRVGVISLLGRVRREIRFERGRADRAAGDGGAKSADGAYLNGFYSEEENAYYLSRADLDFLYGRKAGALCDESN